MPITPTYVIDNQVGASQTVVDQITATMNAAVAQWSAVLAGSMNTTIRIEIMQQTSSGRAQGGVGQVFAVGGPNGGTTFEGAPGYELRQGTNANGTAHDFIIQLDIDYVLNELFFDATPGTSNDIPNDRTDALSVFVHEIGHGLGFIGYYNETANSFDFGAHSPYDWRIGLISGEVFFNGPNAVSEYGSAVPLTNNNYTHYGNSNAHPSGGDPLTGLMNGVAYYRGYRYSISDLDLAFLADMGLGTINDDIFDQTWLNILRGGAGNDVFAGNYSGAASAVTINGSGVIGTAPGLQLFEIERFDVTLSNHNDTFVGTANNDVVRGGAGHDSLDGGGGNDSMDGGTGDDTYYVDSALDTVTEGVGAGTDTIISSVTQTLGANVENLTLVGANAINGAGNNGNNTITGNNAANVLAGLDGADTLDGAGGNDVLQAHDGVDTLYGRAGNDTLDGGAGADVMYGGDDNDTYIVDNVGDQLIENGPSGGVDLVQSSVTWTLGTGFEHLTLTGANATNGTGNELANTILGNTGANVLNGRAGADTISANLGNDTIYGGDGNDTLGGDAGDDFLDGGNNDDVLAGGADVDTLYGRAGNDNLDGGAGADVMYGGAGDDIYWIDNSGDVAGESAGAGTDTVYISANYAMGAYIENLTVVGDGALNGTGNILNNVMTGAGGANVLSGGAGADTLDGLGGDDTLNGGNGNDTAYGGDGADILDGGNDNDTLHGGANNDTLYGRTGGDTLNGDAGADTIYGGDGDDIANGGSESDLLDGGNGNDTLNGGDGDDDLYGRQNNDTLSGGNGADDLYGGDGDDTLAGGDGVDMLDGGNGVDRLDGGLGADVLIGGTGADTFVFSTATGAGNIDTITGFNVADDTIELSVAVFTGIGLGALAAGAFVTGASAVDGDDRVIYNPATGALFYDADGNGAGAAVQIATLGTGLALTAADIVGGP